ncbi:MAG: hypothetical protein JJ895_14800 [Balneolaceae bacterium]|nr:hypothetical protein [Balneolaceae bacterium]
MSTRNKHQHNNNFDLDQFLEDKANGEESAFTPEEEPGESSNFFRNASIIVVAILGMVLWFYDWNPRAAYAGIFGSDSGEPVVTEVVNRNVNVVTPPTPPAPPVTDAARLAQLERSAVAVANSEEIERLTEQSVALAMESAFRALESFEKMDFSNLEGLGDLEGLEGLERLEGLEGLENFGVLAEQAALDALQNIDFSQIQFETGATNVASFEQFSNELSELSIDQFSDEDLRSLHNAGIPTSFLSKLNDVGLLDRLDADEIIDLFEEE